MISGTRGWFAYLCVCLFVCLFVVVFFGLLVFYTFAVLLGMRDKIELHAHNYYGVSVRSLEPARIYVFYR